MIIPASRNSRKVYDGRINLRKRGKSYGSIYVACKGKIAASGVIKMYICGNEKCHHYTPTLAHE